jgi:hypothetical protein
VHHNLRSFKMEYESMTIPVVDANQSIRLRKPAEQFTQSLPIGNGGRDAIAARTGLAKNGKDLFRGTIQ